MLVPALFIIMIYYKVSRCSIPRNGYTIYDITIELTLKMTFQNSDVHPNTAKEHTPNKRRAHAGVILREEYRGGGVCGFCLFASLFPWRITILEEMMKGNFNVIVLHF